MPASEPVEGLYVHLPFCDGKCAYCAFYSVRYEAALADAYLAALDAELAQQAAATSGSLRLATVYVGGGTPTTLTAPQLERLFRTIRRRVDTRGVREWSVEANPGSLDRDRLAVMRAAGVTRVSLGAQSFDDAVLRRLGRRHTGADIVRSAERLREAGIRNWGLDLIACVPGVGPAAWRRTLRAALGLAPRHVSVYALTLEEGSRLARRARGGGWAAPDDAAALRMLHAAERTLTAAGLARYEISNYARPGCACRHNMACWRGAAYLGIGVAAASRIGARRWRNRADLRGYLAAHRDRRPWPRETETLSPETRAAERLVFGLRLTAGVRLSRVVRRAGVRAESLAAAWERTLDALRRHGLARRRDGIWALTPRGLDVADAIGVELLRGIG